MAMAGPLHVVTLEGIHCPVQEMVLPVPHTYTEYPMTALDPDEIYGRIKDATIVITTIVPITPLVAARCPNLRLVAVMATGCGWLDRPWFEQRGISVINCPQSNIPAVTEHALGLYFAVRKKFVQMHTLTTTSNEWKDKGSLTGYWPSPPPSCANETLCIIGYGALGQRFEMLARAVGMSTILVAERKGTPEAHIRPGRVSFESALRQATVFLICCPKGAETINLIGDAEFAAMKPEAMVINIARGGIVNEQALARALLEHRIFGAATDVFDEEPPTLGENALLPASGSGVPNLLVSPHLSWFSERTIKTLQGLLKDGIESWARGKPINVVVSGRPALL